MKKCKIIWVSKLTNKAGNGKDMEATPANVRNLEEWVNRQNWKCPFIFHRVQISDEDTETRGPQV
jgi:hypothetical protein